MCQPVGCQLVYLVQEVILKEELPRVSHIAVYILFLQAPGNVLCNMYLHVYVRCSPCSEARKVSDTTEVDRIMWRSTPRS